MPRVLIVTSMFLPYLAADMHRARHLAAELPQLGWDVELLVPGNSFQLQEHYEPRSDRLALEVPVYHAQPKFEKFFNLIGSRTLSVRAYFPIRELGAKLLENKSYDLIYFSCAQFQLFQLGVAWKKRYDVPFILDFQDPWYVPHVTTAHFKGKFKRKIVNLVAKQMESSTLEYCSGIISVSEKYLSDINERYRSKRWIRRIRNRQVVIPFAASMRDLRLARPSAEKEVSGTTCRTIVYVGAGGELMRSSFKKVCRAIKYVERHEPKLLQLIQVKFYGTEPSCAASASVLTSIAEAEHVSRYFEEYPGRISYIESIDRITSADGLIVLGIDDVAYMPSKYFQYGLTGKPVFACLKDGSVLGRYIREQDDSIYSIYFGLIDEEDVSIREGQAMIAYLKDVIQRKNIDRARHLLPWTDKAMAEKHVEFFDACIQGSE